MIESLLNKKSMVKELPSVCYKMDLLRGTQYGYAQTPTEQSSEKANDRV